MDQLNNIVLIIAGAGAISLVSLLMAVKASIQYRKLYRKYDAFMRGRDAESLEQLILETVERLDVIEQADQNSKEVMRAMNRNIRASFQKCGLEKYDAFEGVGGKMSFALALLDYTNSGIIINCMHYATGCFLYVKRVEAGATEVQLGAEEKAAFEKALGYISA